MSRRMRSTTSSSGRSDLLRIEVEFADDRLVMVRLVIAG
jgi:hypothetical protein